MLRVWLAFIPLCLSTSFSFALDLPSAAVESARRDIGYAAQNFPASQFDGVNTTMVEAVGTTHHLAYRLARPSLTTMQLLAPLRAQLEEDGFETRFICEDRECGGFDFRYLLDLIPEPALHVDLGNFRYLLAIHPDGRTIAIVTSRDPQNGYIQITSVTPENTPGVELTTPPIASTETGTYTSALETQGYVALNDLTFESGSTVLGAGPFASLIELSGYLNAHPGTHVVLVGHSDTIGGLAANTALSRQRAEAVQQRLMSAYDVRQTQLDTDGIGYLAPRASNNTDEGRATNRRVEAVLTSAP